MGLTDVHLRVLKPIWAEALASGAKPFEVQRYKDKYMNSCNFARRWNGQLLLVGASKCDIVQCIAKIQQSTFQCTKEEVEVLEKFLPEHLKDPFKEYIEGGKWFDVLMFDLPPSQ